MGVHVVDLDSGNEVFSHNADQTSFLASLTKIFTVGAAIETLGGDMRFTTRFSSATPELAHFSGWSVLVALDRLVSGGGGADLTH